MRPVNGSPKASTFIPFLVWFGAMRPEIGNTGQRVALNGGRGPGRGINTSLTTSGSVYMNE